LEEIRGDAVGSWEKVAKRQVYVGDD